MFHVHKMLTISAGWYLETPFALLRHYFFRSTLTRYLLMLSMRCCHWTIANCNIQLKIECNSTLAKNVYYKLENTREQEHKCRRAPLEMCWMNLTKWAPWWNEMCVMCIRVLCGCACVIFFRYVCLGCLVE